MTNKQAKEIMLKLKEEITNDFDVLEDEEKEAFNKAIEALEQEPSEDTVSTKEVMKILTALMSEAGKDGKLILSDAKEMIMDLPNVQPKQEPCDDVVSRAKVQTALMMSKDAYLYRGHPTIRISDAVQAIRELPSIRPQEQTGHWIIDKGSLDAFYGEVCKCSKCGVESIGESDYCPYCGAKMVEPQESEE